MSLEQNSFRFRNDDGSELVATWKAGVNVDVQMADLEQDFRIRFLIKAVGAETPSGYLLQYSLNGGAWTTVTTTSSVVKSVTSTYFANADATTQQIGVGVFIAGEMDEQSGASGGDFGGADLVDEETELEGVYRLVAADVAPNDTIDLRIVEVGPLVLDTYTEIPRITVFAIPTLPTSAWRYRRLQPLRCM